MRIKVLYMAVTLVDGSTVYNSTAVDIPTYLFEQAGFLDLLV